MVQLILKDIFLLKKRLLIIPFLYSIFIIIVLQDSVAPFLVTGVECMNKAACKKRTLSLFKVKNSGKEYFKY